MGSNSGFVDSFLGLSNLHVLITGASGGIGSEAVREFLEQGCLVTALDIREINKEILVPNTEQHVRLQCITADISSEPLISKAVNSAAVAFGPINILVANAGISDELNSFPIWDTPVERWDRITLVNYRGTFLTIKHFLQSAKQYQERSGSELENLAIVVTGSECGKYGQEGHVDYSSGKAGLQYGLVRTVKNEIVRLNARARINAVAPGWVDTPLIDGRLDDPEELWAETQATVALKKIATPSNVARTMAFLASHRAAGHMTGEVISVDGGMEGRLLWRRS